jgi:hypothetical protein
MGKILKMYTLLDAPYPERGHPGSESLLRYSPSRLFYEAQRSPLLFVLGLAIPIPQRKGTVVVLTDANCDRISVSAKIPI